MADKSDKTPRKKSALKATDSGDSAQQQQQQGKTTPSSSQDQRTSSAADNGKSPRRTAGGSGGATPRSPNKIYRTPPTPPPVELHTMEHRFVLDCIAVNSTSNDYSKAKPKLGQVIPPYNSQRDQAAKQYFKLQGVDKTLKFYKQEPPGTSIEGPVIDKFYQSGAGFKYLSLRNNSGAGHSRDTIDGHGQFMSGIQPIVGYNGQYGYRRNTPWLRRMPSTFGVATDSPIY